MEVLVCACEQSKNEGKIKFISIYPFFFFAIILCSRILLFHAYTQHVTILICLHISLNSIQFDTSLHGLHAGHAIEIGWLWTTTNAIPMFESWEWAARPLAYFRWRINCTQRVWMEFICCHRSSLCSHQKYDKLSVYRRRLDNRKLNCRQNESYLPPKNNGIFHRTPSSYQQIHAYSRHFQIFGRISNKRAKLFETIVYAVGWCLFIFSLLQQNNIIIWWNRFLKSKVCTHGARCDGTN